MLGTPLRLSCQYQAVQAVSVSAEYLILCAVSFVSSVGLQRARGRSCHFWLPFSVSSCVCVVTARELSAYSPLCHRNTTNLSPPASEDSCTSSARWSGMPCLSQSS